MSKAFDKIKAGLEDAVAYAESRADEGKYGIHVPAEVDVKAIRTKMGLSQDQFGVASASLRRESAIGSRAVQSPTAPPAPILWSLPGSPRRSHGHSRPAEVLIHASAREATMCDRYRQAAPAVSIQVTLGAGATYIDFDDAFVDDDGIRAVEDDSLEVLVGTWLRFP